MTGRNENMMMIIIMTVNNGILILEKLFMIIMMIIRSGLSSVFVTTNQRQKSFVWGQKASAEAISYF